MIKFNDGNFTFWTATYGSWAGDKVIVFRVREDTTPKKRAEKKGITCYDRLVPSDAGEVAAWLRSHLISTPHIQVID